MNRGRKYTLIYPDGSTFSCHLAEVWERLRRDFNTTASRDLIQKRIIRYKGFRVIAEEAARPPTGNREAGMVRWKKDKTPTIQPYENVEGFDGPVSALHVWKKFVVEPGLKGPGRDTIKKRLKQGMRTRLELLDDRALGCPGRPKNRPLYMESQIKKMNEDKEKKKEKTIIDIDEIVSKVKNMEPTKCGNDLPPMRDWIPDKNFYRRQPL